MGLGHCGNMHCMCCNWDRGLPSEKTKRQRREGELEYKEDYLERDDEWEDWNTWNAMEIYGMYEPFELEWIDHPSLVSG